MHIHNGYGFNQKALEDKKKEEEKEEFESKNVFRVADKRIIVLNKINIIDEVYKDSSKKTGGKDSKTYKCVYAFDIIINGGIMSFRFDTEKEADEEKEKIEKALDAYYEAKRC